MAGWRERVLRLTLGMAHGSPRLAPAATRGPGGTDDGTFVTSGRLRAVSSAGCGRRWSSAAAKRAETSAPTTAIATSPATRATALLTPEAIPAWCCSTDDSTVAVSGATVADRPSANRLTPGR